MMITSDVMVVLVAFVWVWGMVKTYKLSRHMPDGAKELVRGSLKSTR
jgi:hypothetical protein